MAKPARRILNANHSAVRVLLILLVLFLLTLSVASLLARAPPPIPMTTQGDAFDRSGAPLPIGTMIRVLVDGVDYSNDSAVLNAQGGFAVATAGNPVLNGTTPEPSGRKEGANLGESLVFVAGSFATQVNIFQEILFWHPDLTVTQNLHLATVATTPDPIRIQGVVTQPAQGGPQYVLLCNPTAASVSLADYYLQVDRPGTYFGGNLTLSGSLGADSQARVNLTSAFPLIPTGDALKLVYRNPGGAGAPAGRGDVVIDRLEFNATTNGTLDWQPGSTILGAAPAPGPGQILERSPFCSAGPAPATFQLAREPGLPAAGSPTVTITTPSAGQNVQGGQPFTIRWTMSDPVFVSTYLRVWVNVTAQGSTTTLVSDAMGATSVDWHVPDVSASNVVIQVSVANPYGAVGNATTTVTVLPSTPYSAYIAIVVIVVIALFILLAFYYARRRDQPPRLPPAQPPPGMPVAPAETAPPSQAATTKTCPKCGTVVGAADETCFYCGHSFVAPPP